jgi:uncharacterized protein YkwD
MIPSLLAVVLVGLLISPVARAFVENGRRNSVPAPTSRLPSGLHSTNSLNRHDAHRYRSPYSSGVDDYDRQTAYDSPGRYVSQSDLHRSDYGRPSFYSSSSGAYSNGYDTDEYWRRNFPASSTLRLQAARDAFYAGLYKDTRRDYHWDTRASTRSSFPSLPPANDQLGYRYSRTDDYNGKSNIRPYSLDSMQSLQDYRYNNGGYGSPNAFGSSTYGLHDNEMSYYRPPSSESFDRRNGHYGNSEFRHSSREQNYYRPYSAYARVDYEPRTYSASTNNLQDSRYGVVNSGFDGCKTSSGDRYDYGGQKVGNNWLNSRPDDQRHWSSEKPLRRNPYYLSTDQRRVSNQYSASVDYNENRYDAYDARRDRYDGDYSSVGSKVRPYDRASSSSSETRYGSEYGIRVVVSQDEERNFQYVQRERRERGLPELLWSEDLAREAQRWARHLANEGELYHRKPLSQNIDEGWITVTENVAYNPSVGYDGAHTSFMQSPGHRKNILDPNVNRLGVGVAKVWYPGSEKYRAGDLYYVVQIFKQVRERAG